MPPQTLAAYRDHGEPALRLEDDLDQARALAGRLRELGIDLEQVCAQVGAEGVQKFVQPFDALLAQIERRRNEQ